MATGVITHWNSERAFGFVKPDGGGLNRFFHLFDCKRRRDLIRQGLRVTYEEGEGEKGPRALYVEPLEGV